MSVFAEDNSVPEAGAETGLLDDVYDLHGDLFGIGVANASKPFGSWPSSARPSGISLCMHISFELHPYLSHAVGKRRWL